MPQLNAKGGAMIATGLIVKGFVRAGLALRALVISVCIGVVLVGGAVYWCALQGESSRPMYEARVFMDRVIRQIEFAKGKGGRYPDRIDAIVGECEEMPLFIRNRQWHYDLDASGEYRIYIYELPTSGVACPYSLYQSKSKTWMWQDPSGR